MLVLYRDQPNGLEPDGLADGLVLADLATSVLLGLQSGAPPDALHATVINSGEQVPLRSGRP